LELKKEIETRLLEKVHETNIAEAKTRNWFIAVWRPFIGWVCSISIGYSFVFTPFLHSNFKAFEWIFLFPELDSDSSQSSSCDARHGRT